jgi:hypothetical protein
MTLDLATTTLKVDSTESILKLIKYPSLGLSYHSFVDDLAIIDTHLNKYNSSVDAIITDLQTLESSKEVDISSFKSEILAEVENLKWQFTDQN